MHQASTAANSLSPSLSIRSVVIKGHQMVGKKQSTQAYWFMLLDQTTPQERCSQCLTVEISILQANAREIINVAPTPDNGVLEVPIKVRVEVIQKWLKASSLSVWHLSHMRTPRIQAFPFRTWFQQISSKRRVMFFGARLNQEPQHVWQWAGEERNPLLLILLEGSNFQECEKGSNDRKRLRMLYYICLGQHWTLWFRVFLFFSFFPFVLLGEYSRDYLFTTREVSDICDQIGSYIFHVRIPYHQFFPKRAAAYFLCRIQQTKFGGRPGGLGRIRVKGGFGLSGSASTFATRNLQENGRLRIRVVPPRIIL